MVRTVVSLDPEDKAWLDARARRLGRPMTALVREAVARMRAQESESGEDTLSEVLARTHGLSKQGDGRARQRRLRDEWARR
ncbi:MAG: ribbon-helix-helix protein, CopG family [Steroidobacteraceae bacterium]|nr:ribbon-helix-helix protein, CopG family [Steroidobacteraceae bacterium]